MAQMLGGLITYLLLAIYCHEEHNERVSITAAIKHLNVGAALAPPDRRAASSAPTAGCYV